MDAMTTNDTTRTAVGASMHDRRRRPTPTCADGALVVESLTARELEVLGHLSQLLTTEEIAATMFVSVNTVRTHVRGVLRKLSATRRNEAVRRAWELQLLPRRADLAPPRDDVPVHWPGMTPRPRNPATIESFDTPT